MSTKNLKFEGRNLLLGLVDAGILEKSKKGDYRETRRFAKLRRESAEVLIDKVVFKNKKDVSCFIKRVNILTILKFFDSVEENKLIGYALIIGTFTEALEETLKKLLNLR